MKNKTLTAAMKLGFDFENADFDSKEELQGLIMQFLNESESKIKNIENQFCEVTSNGRSQNVSFGDFTSSGRIVNYSEYYRKRKQRIYHTSIVTIDKDGAPVIIRLYCYSK